MESCEKGHLLAPDGSCHVCRGDETELATAQETATGYEITIPESGGVVRFRFDNLEERRHVLQAEVSAWAELPGITREPFSARMNVLSMSGRESFRRGVEDVVPLAKETWTRLLNRACVMLRHTYAQADPAVDLGDVTLTDVAPAYVAYPLASADGPSIPFGPNASMKTYLALLLAICVGKGADFLGYSVTQAGVLFLDYEATATRIKARVLRVLDGLGLDWDGLRFTYWPARGRALPEMIPALQRRIRQDGIGLIIVDSAALAAGAEPEKAETALRFFNALSALEVPSLTIAHVTKQHEDQYPFGSIFWSNSARLTWNVKAEHEEGHGNVVHVGLYNRKANDDRLLTPFGVRVEFDETSVRFEREDLRVGVDDRTNLGSRIRAALVGTGRASVKALASELDLQTDVVRVYLNRLPDAHKVGKSDDQSGLWEIRADEP